MAETSILQFSPLFKGVTEEEILLLLQRFPYRMHDYKKEQLVLLADTPLKYLHIVVSGSVRGVIPHFSGDSVYVEDITAPNILAPAFLFTQEALVPVDVIANTDVRLLKMKKTTFLTLLQEDSRILTNFLSLISHKALFLRKKMEFLSLTTIRQKLSYYLLKKYEKEGEVIHISESLEKLSRMFGIARPSLSRELKYLNDSGIIAREKKRVCILNSRALRAFLDA
ncbi:Crp/Fnr family transcriptional regulator [Chitinivibrio alkaliphilus]|uniref:cAMP-binding domain-containing protein n=1 Tax=Chitinivibrio alkaliphilus ACht1 TaxID=1313304 RepID=U7DBQ3_9BACT|nr:Crp/Fnr family transcriptional regulator [Chitinivibrio alkaliphilus]ERP39013.1 cAMP-binding domain-containing protein [Chitinivibrio alkaliphilus ACht1]